MHSSLIYLRTRCTLALVACVPVSFALHCTPCSAQDVLKIEEHWELSVGGPDEGRCAPQVSMVMSPTGDLDCDYFIFSLNHLSHPGFTPGGLELQHWNGEELVSFDHDNDYGVLDTDGETITWIQQIEISDEELTYKIINGTSQTWGSFGGSDQLTTSMPTQLTRLNGYRPQVSIEGSGIGYAGNRVSSLTLKKLVWWTSDGEVHEMVAPIDIDTDIDP